MEFDRYKLVPSAYGIEFKHDFKHDGNDETYILNKTRPRILPCEPQIILVDMIIFYHLIAHTVVYYLGS